MITSICSLSLYFLTRFFIMLALLMLISTPVIFTPLWLSAMSIDLLPGAQHSSRTLL